MTATLLSAGSPLRRMWVHPRATVREQLSRGPTLAVWILPILSGIAQTFIQGSSNDVGLRGPAIVILAVALPIGAVWGVIQVNLIAGLLALVERWTGGRATFVHLRIALAWAAVPQVLLVVVWLLGTAVAGRFVFVQDPDRAVALGASPVALLTVGVAYLVAVVCALWWFVLTVFSVAEAQGGSAWKALGSLILAGLMFGIVAVVILTLVIGVAHA